MQTNNNNKAELTNFTLFKAGTIFNQVLNKDITKNKPIKDQISIKIPLRLNAMAIDPGAIVTNKNSVYTPGEVIFKIKLFNTISVKILKNTDQIICSNSVNRPSVALHAALLMKQALGFEHGLEIEVLEQEGIKHCGFGSTSSMLAGVMLAINLLYDKPISDRDLLKYSAQNHGEETKDPLLLKSVQAIGGSCAGMLYEGSTIILLGESQVIINENLKQNYSVVVAVAADYNPLDGETLMNLEEQNLDKFMLTSKDYAHTIAYNMLHKVLPDIQNGNLKELAALVYNYRFNMGSINNCSFIYPPMSKIANQVRVLKDSDPSIMELAAISSVGPAFFFITLKPKELISELQNLKNVSFRIIETTLYNGKYIID